MSYPYIQRRKTRSVDVGGVTIGSDAPVSIQSMTNTTTADAAATIDQVKALADAGADIVRVAAATPADTAALGRIVQASPVPIVADVHFRFARAIEAIQAGVAKIRLNPGNISDRDEVLRVIAEAANANVAIRVGVNEGSIVSRTDDARRSADLAAPLDELMLLRLNEYLEVFQQADFHNVVLSAKSHDAVTTIAVNRRIAKRWDYPLHLGVTHAGTRQTGAIRSAAAMGALLAEGIGDTMRISYAGDPVHEVTDACELLWSLRLKQRDRIELIACPTCGRTMMDIAPVAEQITIALADIRKPITVAVMGCVVNGPGEADGADVAICAGKDKAILYRRGQKLRSVPADQMVQAVVAEVRALAKDSD